MPGVPGNSPIPARLATARIIEVTGTNLFTVAALYLGDATQWNRIAALNGMTDPWIFAGVKTLILPPYNANAGNGGVLEAPTNSPAVAVT